MLRERTLAWGFICMVTAATPAPAADKAANRPFNVLMIAVDDLRPDMGCYGNSVAKTPNIDRLAARGVVFGHAYCQQAVCSPSRTSLMTGQRPDITRVLDLKTHFRTALPDCVTLPQHFKANGYHCAALSKIYHRGYEDGRSWSEPHWYPNGKTVDADPNDWTKQTTKKVGGGVEEYSADTPRAESGKGPATVVSDKSDDELPDGYTAAAFAGCGSWAWTSARGPCNGQRPLPPAPVSTPRSRSATCWPTAARPAWWPSAPCFSTTSMTPRPPSCSRAWPPRRGVAWPCRTSFAAGSA